MHLMIGLSLSLTVNICLYIYFCDNIKKTGINFEANEFFGSGGIG